MALIVRFRLTRTATIFSFLNPKRVIPLSQRLRETLLAIRETKGKISDIQQRVFLSAREKPFARPAAVREAFINAVERAKLKDVHWAVVEGAPSTAIVSLLSHSPGREPAAVLGA
jgi:hypothetical protein